MSNAYKADTTVFRDHLSEEIFNHKYAHEGCETWPDLANTLVDDVCTGLLDKTDLDTLKWMIATMRFIPGGRYLYYADVNGSFSITVSCWDALMIPVSNGLSRFTMQPCV